MCFLNSVGINKVVIPLITDISMYILTLTDSLCALPRLPRNCGTIELGHNLFAWARIKTTVKRVYLPRQDFSHCKRMERICVQNISTIDTNHRTHLKTCLSWPLVPNPQ